MGSKQQSIYDGIVETYERFCKDAVAGMKGNKAAAARARQASLRLREGLKEFRVESIAATRRRL